MEKSIRFFIFKNLFFYSNYRVLSITFCVNYYRSLLLERSTKVLNTHNTRRLLTADNPFGRSIGKSITVGIDQTRAC